MNKTIATVVLSLMAGCSNLPVHQRAEYRTEPLRIIVKSEEEVNASYRLYKLWTEGVEAERVTGFQIDNTIYVRYDKYKTDKNGNALPDFETLGHEVWHTVKGKYHE